MCLQYKQWEKSRDSSTSLPCGTPYEQSVTALESGLDPTWMNWERSVSMPMFLRSSNMTALLRILSYVRVSGISKMATCNQKWIYTTNLPQALTWKSIWISPVMMLDAKNIAIAVGILLHHIYTSWDIRHSITISGCRPPSLISHSPRQTVCYQFSRVTWHRKHRYSRWNFVAISHTSWDLVSLFYLKYMIHEIIAV